MLVVAVFMVVAMSFERSLRRHVPGFRTVKAGTSGFANMSAGFVLVHNWHTASEDLVEISLDHGH
jgi:hypothetical protein